MASEIRVNTINNRSGLGTITLTDTGAVFSGITTISDLRTSGTSVVAAGTTAAPSISPTGDSNTGIFFPSADTIAFAKGGVEAARIDSSGRVGIGTDNPTGNGSETSTHIHATNYPVLHLTNSTTGTSASDGSELTLNNDGSLILRNRENSFIRFDTNGSERLRVTSFGSLSAYTTDTGGHRLRSSSASSANLTALEVLNSATSTTDGTVVARIRTNGDIQTNGNIILSTSGAGIDFSATANSSGTMTSELLSDYEEGTWTPIASASSGTITSYTSSGRYTKIGRTVTLHFAITISNQGTASGAYLLWSGAPFTASNTINQMGVAREMNVNGYLMSCLINGNSTNGGFFRWDNSGVIVNGNFQGMIVYNVD